MGTVNMLFLLNMAGGTAFLGTTFYLSTEAFTTLYIYQESSRSDENGMFLFPPALLFLPGTTTKSILLTEEIVCQRQHELKCIEIL